MQCGNELAGFVSQQHRLAIGRLDGQGRRGAIRPCRRPLRCSAGEGVEFRLEDHIHTVHLPKGMPDGKLQAFLDILPVGDHSVGSAAPVKARLAAGSAGAPGVRLPVVKTQPPGAGRERRMEYIHE
jgi:hypothetical protein